MKKEEMINLLNAIKETLDGYKAFDENPNLESKIDNAIKDVKYSILDQNTLNVAQKWFSEQLGFKTQMAYDKSTIELFINNGKGDDGKWIGISKSEVEMAAECYWQAKNEELSEEYLNFMNQNDLNPSKETEIAFAKYLLSENRHDDALNYVDDEDELKNIESELNNNTSKITRKR